MMIEAMEAVAMMTAAMVAATEAMVVGVIGAMIATEVPDEIVAVTIVATDVVVTMIIDPRRGLALMINQRNTTNSFFCCRCVASHFFTTMECLFVSMVCYRVCGNVHQYSLC